MSRETLSLAEGVPPVYLGATRPAMTIGVSYGVWLVWFCLTAALILGGLLLAEFKGLLFNGAIAGVLLLLFRESQRSDPYLLIGWWKWLALWLRTFSSQRRWGAKRYHI